MAFCLPIRLVKRSNWPLSPAGEIYNSKLLISFTKPAKRKALLFLTSLQAVQKQPSIASFISSCIFFMYNLRLNVMLYISSAGLLVL
jgi:hypothetical protein